MKIKFSALEYTREDSFQKAEYEFDGNEESGWKIYRNNEIFLSLNKGYKLLKSVACGVCSTDLDRRFLPFPLPQITGHEVLAEDSEGKRYVVEINDTYQARGVEEDNFCKLGIPTHSPSRMVLGIDRLPGGFGKYILAPKNAIVSIGKVPEKVAILTEPFAAALQAIIASPPQDGQRVAVLGPRRLGSLLIAALYLFRKQQNLNFEIIAIARRAEPLKLTKQLGSDREINLQNISIEKLTKEFDIVYDTTANPQGFEIALKLAKKEVHLKSTNGLEVCGIKNMTALVVDELSILPYSKENLEFHWQNDTWKNETVYISPLLRNVLEISNKLSFSPEFSEFPEFWNRDPFKNKLPRFDIAIAQNIQEIDTIIRPFQNSEESLVRPRGAILVYGNINENPLLNFIQSGGILKSSRCGNFHLALKLLEENLDYSEKLEKLMISHELSSEELPKAFEIARSPESKKVIVRH